LGPYGYVQVAGLSLEQVRAAISKHLTSYAKKDKLQIRVEVVAFNSKVFYLITAGKEGDEVKRFPLMGFETVASVIQAEKLTAAAAEGHVFVTRLTSDSSFQVMEVDWPAIARKNQSATNYKLEAGDRLYVRGAMVASKQQGGQQSDAAERDQAPAAKPPTAGWRITLPWTFLGPEETDPAKLLSARDDVAASGDQPKAASAPPDIPEKLDRILNQLENLDCRLRKIEQMLSDPAKASQLPSSEPKGLAGFIKSLGSFRLIHCYSSDPSTRMKELLDNSEDLRQIEAEWKRIWLSDQPSHLKPERVHGGIQ
jgi:hypothetical protein